MEQQQEASTKFQLLADKATGEMSQTSNGGSNNGGGTNRNNDDNPHHESRPLTGSSDAAGTNNESQMTNNAVAPMASNTDAVVVSNSSSSDSGDIKWYQCPLQLVAMLSNYSTSYNVVNISLALPMFEQLLEGTKAQDVATSASSLLFGMILGQLGGGYLGDSAMIGRLGALQLVMTLQVVASLGSALIPISQPTQHFYIWMALFRFLLGVGAGGVYPLAAVLSAEEADKEESAADPAREHHPQSAKQVRRVVLTFSTQGLGFISAPMVAVSLLYMTSNLNLVWRILLAIGSLPGLALMVAQLLIYRRKKHEAAPLHEEEEHNSAQPTSQQDESQQQAQQHSILLHEMQIMEEQLRESTSRWDAIRHESNILQKFMGTACTWFLFDVLFYGNTLFQPIVMDAAFGSGGTEDDPIDALRGTAWKSVILAAIALPGYAIAGIVMGRRVCCILQTPKYVMLQGFAAMFVLYLAIGLQWDYLRQIPAALVALYGLTFFFANYGPNTTTFILPSLVFSPECRTTLNGMSAAAGKLGALTGASLFEPAAASFGNATVMLICAGVAVVSWFMTCQFVQMHPSINSQQHLNTAHVASRNEIV